MKKLKSNEIRVMWLDFFKSKHHYVLDPVSLIPVEDPSLLWINSGVATLKPYFDGRKTPPNQRLTNSQRSIRTNDIENVGVTARHQTMFEMLGNFSIGDYFKLDAIKFAWELLTDQNYFAIELEKLYITVFEDDVEAYDIWTKEIKVSPDHIFKGSRDTNFWDVGQGPCGPNTEIFYDRGEEWDPNKIGTRLLEDDIENDRYIEIWNIVFSQFNNDGQNNYTELPRKNIDTGAGLERLVAISQNAPTNFETDLFLPTIKMLESISTKRYFFANPETLTEQQKELNTAFKVIADHIRAITFAIADGVYPSNKDRGYVIRRLIRRAVIYARKLDITSLFLNKLVDAVIVAMGEFYTFLIPKVDFIKTTIKSEEEKFSKTLTQGLDYLSSLIEKNSKISAKQALLLFESYGFPIELILEISSKSNVDVDVEGFTLLLQKNKEQSRESRKAIKVWNTQNELFTNLTVESKFIGWTHEEKKNAKIVFMFQDGIEITSVKTGLVGLVLDSTPFYAEKGGQAGDSGILIKNETVFEVLDTQQGPHNQNIHYVNVNSELKLHDVVDAVVDKEKRHYTMKNHSATHLLHAAVRAVLGNNVIQSGSHNDEEMLRLDFNFNRNLTEQEISAIQELANAKVNAKIPREVFFTTMDEAVNKYHALAFFTEKYDQIVRIVRFSEFSCELCGGTHVENSSDIEQILIIKVESKGSGLLRLYAITSHLTIQNYVNNEFAKVIAECADLMSNYNEQKNLKNHFELEQKQTQLLNLEVKLNNLKTVKSLLEEFKDLYKEWNKQIININLQNSIVKYLDLNPVVVNNINEFDLTVDDLNMEAMKYLATSLKNKVKSCVVKLINKKEGLVIILVSDDLTEKFSAIDIFKTIKNAKGGGSSKFAQGKII